MKINFNKFEQMEMPSIVVCTPNMEELCEISLVIYETNMSIKYNSLSEFSFKIPKKLNLINYSDIIKSKKLIFVEDIGYFIVTDVSEADDGSSPVLSVYSQSLEAELLYKRISLFDIMAMPLKQEYKIDKIESKKNTPIKIYLNSHSFINGQSLVIVSSGSIVNPLTNKGTYYVSNSNIKDGTFEISRSIAGDSIIGTGEIQYDEINIYLGIIDKLLIQYIPNWKFKKDASGNDMKIPDSLSSLYRSFTITNSTTIYSFLIDAIEKAYNCIIKFDYKERSFYVEDSVIENRTFTDIYLSHENLIIKSSFKEFTDELANSILCYGGGGMDIRRANPLGTNNIYNFDYYKNEKWMTQELIEKLSYWEAKVKNQEENISEQESNSNYHYLMELKNLCYEYSKYSNVKKVRQSEIDRQEYLLSQIEGNSDVAIKKRAYYFTNIEYLKFGKNTDKIPTKTLVNTLNQTEYYQESIIIPERQKLKDLYSFDIYGGMEYIDNDISNYGETENIFIDKINEKVSIIKNISLTPIKYTKKINEMADSYYEVYDYVTIHDELDTLYSVEKTLLKNSTYNNNLDDISDHKNNMAYLMNANNSGAEKPSTKNGLIKNKNNEIDTQKLINIGMLSGKKDNEKDISIGYGGIYNLKELINSILDYDISDKKSLNQYSYITKLLEILKYINSSLSIKDNLGQNYLSLLPIIIENTYKNDNIIANNIMSEADLIRQSLYLYNQSKDILDKISHPAYEFSVDVPNFISLISYKDTYTKELEVGNIITLVLEEKEIKTLLLEINFSFDDLSEMTLTFSNKLRLNNSYFQYYDLLGSSSKIGDKINAEKIVWSDWSDNYKNDVINFISSSLNATNNEIINSSNEEISIGSYGIRGRKKLEDGGYSKDELWVTNNQIAFTSDNWSSSNSFIGKIQIDRSGVEKYGIVGESIIGKLISGNNLIISSAGTTEDGNSIFQILEDKIKIRNMDLSISKQNVETGTSTVISINPDDGLKIYMKNSNGENIGDMFFLDENGDMNMKSINIQNAGNFKINEEGLSFDRIEDNVTIENYIYPEKLFLGNPKKSFISINDDIYYKGSIHFGPNGKGITIPITDDTGDIIFEGGENDKLFTSLNIVNPNTGIPSGVIHVTQDVNVSTRYIIANIVKDKDTNQMVVNYKEGINNPFGSHRIRGGLVLSKD